MPHHPTQEELSPGFFKLDATLELPILSSGTASFRKENIVEYLFILDYSG